MTQSTDGYSGDNPDYADKTTAIPITPDFPGKTAAYDSDTGYDSQTGYDSGEVSGFTDTTSSGYVDTTDTGYADTTTTPTSGSTAGIGYLGSPAYGGTTETSKTDQVKGQATQVAGAAKEQATQVKGAATSAASDVVSTAKTQASTTISAAKDQATQVAAQTKDQLKEQLTAQQQKAATSIQDLAKGFIDLADGNASSGPAQDLVREVGTRIQSFASYVENKEPAELVSDFRYFAQRRPGIFLLSAAGAGFIVSRFVKGTKTGSSATSTGVPTDSYTTPAVSPTSSYSGGAYDTPAGTSALYGAGTSEGQDIPGPYAAPKPEGAYRG